VALDYAGRGESERSRATDAARPEGTKVRLAEPLGLLSRVATGVRHEEGHSAWPNTRYVINELANSMCSGVAGPTRFVAPAPGSLAMFAAIRRASFLLSSCCPSASRTMKQLGVTSADQGAGKGRGEGMGS